MTSEHPVTREWLARPTLHPERATWLRRLDAIAQVIGCSAAVIGHGQHRSGVPPWEFGLVVIFAMAVITLAIGLRYRWSLKRASFGYRHLWTVMAAVCWLIGLSFVTIFGPVLPDWNGEGLGGSRWWGYVSVSEIVLVVYCISGFIRGLRFAASGGVNPAFLLVMSFVLLIAVGTATLMLPVCRRFPPEGRLIGAPLLTALFTSTSASCVTGLIVEETASYWSPVGQFVIMILFQIGGLGIMTFGVFFAAVAGRNVRLAEYATLRDLFASEGLGDLKQLVFAILGFTLAAEFTGAVLLMSLWPGHSITERIFFGLFHSVSAFCNAGFALDQFVGRAGTWQVGGILTILIIVGGLGFAVLHNLISFLWNFSKQNMSLQTFRFPSERIRLRLTTKLVLSTTAILLVGGTFAIYLLERTGDHGRNPINLADAWFQSVTFRTAGFNTVEIAELAPGTKLLGIILMAIGASPGSTGGGLKTTVFAVAIVGLFSVMRGRERVEAFGRTVPAVNVNRAMAVLLVSGLTIMTASLLLVVFENRSELFLDYLFEAASAAGTVGLSSGYTLPDGETISITQSLSSPSRIVVIVTMFLGRVGPLTLLLALAGESPTVRYEYPNERVTLG